jgi:imidazolonepropionase
LHLPARAPARALIDAGAAVALATDCNPGSCLTESLANILTIACVELRMTPAEALVAATVNAAHAIDRGSDRGSLEFGKWADIVLWDAPTWSYIPSHFGVSLVDRVIKRGRLVFERGRHLHREVAPRTTLTDA